MVDIIIRSIFFKLYCYSPKVYLKKQKIQNREKYWLKLFLYIIS